MMAKKKTTKAATKKTAINKSKIKSDDLPKLKFGEAIRLIVKKKKDE